MKATLALILLAAALGAVTGCGKPDATGPDAGKRATPALNKPLPPPAPPGPTRSGPTPRPPLPD